MKGKTNVEFFGVEESLKHERGFGIRLGLG